MKKLFIISLLSIVGVLSAQTTIDKTSKSSTSSSLEFGDNQNRGLVVPWVNSTAVADASGAVNGTIVYDLTDKRVKSKVNGAWKDFSTASGAADASIQTAPAEVPSLKAVVGATSSTAPGVLVLEENNKAMILPREANPHLNIKNPPAGMIVYDTVNKQVASYNGTNWSFWQ